jgi:hypothetical protein
VYEHREHTDFIGLGDWDDLWIGSADLVRPLAGVVEALHASHPTKGNFLAEVHGAGYWTIGRSGASSRFHKI